MFIFSALVPHSPLFAPGVNKEKQDLLQASLKAYCEVEQALYLAKPDTLAIISPHAQMYPDAFSGNVANQFTGKLIEFGDHGTEVKAKLDFLIMDHLHRRLRQDNVPFTLTSQEAIDYGFTIPLLLLTKNLPNVKLLPLSPSLLSPQQHVEFGHTLKEVLLAEDKRLALIVSADLSHHSVANAVDDQTTEGRIFDAAIRQKIANLDAPGLLALDQTVVEKAKQCAYRPALMLLGALDGMNCQVKELCYETPFGVGYLTVRFEFA